MEGSEQITAKKFLRMIHHDLYENPGPRYQIRAVREGGMERVKSAQ